jgi:hypothetical protein
MTCGSDSHYFLRKVVLRAYWDGEEHPSIESPLGDFFGMGHAQTRNYSSLPMQASPRDGKAFNCYFPMPFGKGMRITVTNEAEDSFRLYYYVDLELHDALEEGLGRFHAQYRQEIPKGIDGTGMSNEDFQFAGRNTDGKDNYTILSAEGAGHYVGALFSVYSRRRSHEWDWYGEGDDMIFVDGEPGFQIADRPPQKPLRVGTLGPAIGERPESAPGANDAWPPTLHGTGTEDYFNTAWCPNNEFSAPYHGIIAGGGSNWSEPVTVYRWHIEDPVIFQKRIRVTIEHGHANRRSDETSSVAFWYQAEPHKPFEPLPDVKARLPGLRRNFT